jgi:GTP-binding protein LepA
MEKNQIRNFAIIAHVDHGKSTLADRILELTNTVKQREMQNQFLDQNPISRERGITIKLAPVRITYQLSDRLKKIFNFDFCTLNLIDTPGHVDFSYEVSRSLSACEGAILLIDATQGIQAQTLAHARLAKSLGLKIIPVINKIDIPNARIDDVVDDLVKIFGFDREEIFLVSAKTGDGVEKILETIVEKIPPPKGNEEFALRALIFDSVYDDHQGIIAYIRIVDGNIEVKNLDQAKFKTLATNTVIKPIEFGFFNPKRTPSQKLSCGEVGYIATGLKKTTLIRIGDTITNITPQKEHQIAPLSGYQELKPMVFYGFFPKSGDEFAKLAEALEKLHLNDSSFTSSAESSNALGNGFRIGTLGVLHGEILKERIFREFFIDVIATIPTVRYQIKINGQIIFVKSVQDIPDLFDEIYEPWMKIIIFSPQEYTGSIMTLCQEKRAKLIDLLYHSGSQTELIFEIPLSEMIVNFYDRLKSVSSGFANLDYEFIGYKSFDGVKLTVLLNHEPVDTLSLMVPREKADREAQKIATRLKDAIPRQQFEVKIQIANHARIIASETISPFRKDVIQKLYGGDRSRKDKLLDAQKRGKKKMKQLGKVSLPDEVFVSLYKI